MQEPAEGTLYLPDAGVAASNGFCSHLPDTGVAANNGYCSHLLDPGVAASNLSLSSTRASMSASLSLRSALASPPPPASRAGPMHCDFTPPRAGPMHCDFSPPPPPPVPELDDEAAAGGPALCSCCRCCSRVSPSVCANLRSARCRRASPSSRSSRSMRLRQSLRCVSPFEDSFRLMRSHLVQPAV